MLGFLLKGGVERNEFSVGCVLGVSERAITEYEAVVKRRFFEAVVAFETVQS